jgi:hypothetical protein
LEGHCQLGGSLRRVCGLFPIAFAAKTRISVFMYILSYIWRKEDGKWRKHHQRTTAEDDN